MPEQQIRFDDGAAYERMMGVWSRLVGTTFLDWLAPASNLRWVDVGCGNGAFTELLIERCAPAHVTGVDPSEGQLNFARTRPGARSAQFVQGDAMALPLPDKSCDAAVMALVLFFVPDPARGVAEMTRVVRPGGAISVYVWDMPGGGFPNEPMRQSLSEMGIKSPMPPSADISSLTALGSLWSADRFDAVETKTIRVERRFQNFDEYWTTNGLSPALKPILANMGASDVERLKNLLRKRLSVTDDAQPVVGTGRANAIKGRLRD